MYYDVFLISIKEVHYNITFKMIHIYEKFVRMDFLTVKAEMGKKRQLIKKIARPKTNEFFECSKNGSSTIRPVFNFRFSSRENNAWGIICAKNQNNFFESVISEFLCLGNFFQILFYHYFSFETCLNRKTFLWKIIVI